MFGWFYKSNIDKSRFYLMLSVSLKSGLPIYSSLMVLKDSLPLSWRAIVTSLADKLRNGYPLSTTMQSFKDTFDQLDTKLIYIGESTGRIENICFYLFELYNNKNKIVSKIFSSLTYPTFVIIMALVIGYIVLNFVFPLMMSMYKDMGLKLPWFTQLVKTFVDLLTLKNLIIFVTFLGIVFGAIYAFVGKEKISYFLVDVFSFLPIISKIYKKFIVVNFLYSLSLSIKSGLTMSEGIKLALSTLPKRIVDTHFHDVYKRILEGENLSNILREKKFFDKVVVSFIANYEDTAKIEILDRMIDYLIFDINLAIESIGILEPLLITGVSLFVFALAIAILMPMMNLSIFIAQ